MNKKYVMAILLCAPLFMQASDTFKSSWNTPTNKLWCLTVVSGLATAGVARYGDATTKKYAVPALSATTIGFGTSAIYNFAKDNGIFSSVQSSTPVVYVKIGTRASDGDGAGDVTPAQPTGSSINLDGHQHTGRC